MKYVLTNLRELRERAGLTRQEAATKLFSVTGSWRRQERLAAREQRLMAYEEGKKSISCVSPGSLFDIAEVLECGASELEFISVK